MTPTGLLERLREGDRVHVLMIDGRRFDAAIVAPLVAGALVLGVGDERLTVRAEDLHVVWRLS